MQTTRDLIDRPKWRRTMDRYEKKLVDYERLGEDPELSMDMGTSSVLTQRIIIDQLDVENVDLRAYVGELSLPVLWDMARYNPDTKALNLSGWAAVTEVGVRALSLCMGHSLELINLADTPITDTMVGVLAARLFNIRSLNFSGCKELSDVGMRELTQGVRKTLTSLNISQCTGLTEGALSWLAGTAGAPPRPCSLLQTLNLQSCPRVRDAGLAALGMGCKALHFVNIRECTSITDVGITGITRGCRSLSVLNMYGCIKVTDGGMRAIERSCPLLKSLNVGRCIGVTDSGVEAVGKGCIHLQSLNLAGCSTVSERGVCFIAFHCKSLQYLNVSGCEDVTQRGLTELLHGLPYVEMATSYFGFKPRSGAVDLKLRAQQRTIEDAAARQIQCAYRGGAVRVVLRRLRQEAMERAAAGLIQRHYKGRAARLVVAQMREALRQLYAAIRVQAFIRRLIALAEMLRRRRRREILLEQERYVILVQANYRGRRTRRMDNEVPQAIADMVDERWKQVEEAVAARVQSLVRGRNARKRLGAFREELQHRRRDELRSVTLAQAAYRRHCARLEYIEARRQREIWYFSVREATILIQQYSRRRLAYNRARRCRQERLEMYLYHRDAARLIQRAYLGYLGRKQFWARLRERVVEIRAVTHLQKIYRGRQMMGWKELKYNLMKKKIEAKDQEQRVQIAERTVEMAKLRAANLDRDSASDCEEEEEDWEELYDDMTGGTFWFSPSRNERQEERPERRTWEKSLVGQLVSVFWPLENISFPGKLTKYHASKNRHRVEYDDGDHEWLDLWADRDRVQLQVASEDGGSVWLAMRFCRARGAGGEGGHLRGEEASKAVGDGVLGPEWEEMFDGQTETPYYFNSVTEETRWARPAAVGGSIVPVPEIDTQWAEFLDEFTGNTYFYNEVTGVTKWTDPRLPEGQNEVSKSEAGENLRDRTRRTTSYGGDEEVKPPSKVAAHEAHGQEVNWTKGVDEYGMDHWENSHTGELRWTAPTKAKLVTGLAEGQTVIRERRGAMKAMPAVQSEVIQRAREEEQTHFEKTGERRVYGFSKGRKAFNGTL